MRTALVIGATGLVGKALVYELLKNNEYLKVIILTRKDLVIKHHKLEQHIVDFDNLDDYKEVIKADDIFCCIGTTSAQTPDKNKYRKIEIDYPKKVAELGLQNHANQLFYISAMGSNINSPIFYSKLKAEAENALSELNFKSIHIIKPALLLGARKQLRVGEKMAQYIFKVINPVFIGPLKQYKAITAETVAKAMIKIALQNLNGKHIWPNDKLFSVVGK
ncbi:MAG: NAD-dependent epimerase/dehydratase family protein [Bacteroidia bacterium]